MVIYKMNTSIESSKEPGFTFNKKDAYLIEASFLLKTLEDTPDGL
jgi:hypothetical protein